MSQPLLLIEKKNKVGILTLNRPSKGNALNTQLKRDLLKALASLPPEEKKTRGAEINRLKAGIEAFAANRDTEATQALERVRAAIAEAACGGHGHHFIGAVGAHQLVSCWAASLAWRSFS